ncbi:hypothetical protein [Cyanobium sp. A2C-AMD]|uniref:hypothetical protein n=1 Tax=Cyanobium sp. A2C-AMD TaxID=2823695 RepID=UPI0020CE7B57|nr:hypothetical protein [Cyanobium sp. A2C-AMD]MCP9877928.1 hypothetical protein [Cyanobium sp. A2C-AMD]
MDTHDLESRLGEYLQQLALLEQEDIRIPNQSLILDFFCIDEVFTDFLRKEVFWDTTARYNTWRLINLRKSDPSGVLASKDLSDLLNYKDSQLKDIWTKIVSSTAKHQNNSETILKINKLISVSVAESISPPTEGKDFTVCVESDAPISLDSSNRSRESIKSKAVQIPSKEVGVESNSPSQVNPWLMPLILVSAFGFAAAIIVSALNVSSTSSTDYQTPELPASSDDISGLNQLESDSRNAVLICELRPLIDKANSLTLSDQYLIARKTQLVSSANTAIKFLDQTSGKGNKYGEDPSCTWGEQWFDNHANNEFRAFIAISKKCGNPAINYKYSKDESGNVVTGRGTLNVAGHQKGEIRLPYPQDGDSYISIEKVTCT